MPNRYVLPTDAEHTYKIVQNVNQYLDWTDITKIATNTDNFLENGDPFTTLLTMKATLNEIKKVRNAIAKLCFALFFAVIGGSPEAAPPRSGPPPGTEGGRR